MVKFRIKEHISLLKVQYKNWVKTVSILLRNHGSSDSNAIRTHNRLVRKPTLNHLVKLF